MYTFVLAHAVLAHYRSSYSSQAEHTLDAIDSSIDQIEAAIRAHVLANEEELLEGLLVGGVSDLATR
jgi:hypothetical protein